jgi:cation diffusion facilitator family transporter
MFIDGFIFMSKFPKPIALPKQVRLARVQRSKEVIRAAKLGIGIRVSVILFELVGVFWFQSSALFMDAISSLMDVISTIFLIFCMRLAQRPPDTDHPFGHGRYEPLGGLLLGLLLVVMGVVMAVKQFSEFFQEGSHHVLYPFTWVFSLIAMVLLEVCYRLIIHTAKKENSPALAADAVHYRIDALTSLLATITLLMAAYFPSWSLRIDHIGAIMIAFFMVGIGLYASRDNLHQLMDKVPDPSFFEKVKQAASHVKGVKGTEKIRIQLYGPDAHVDIDIEVEPELPVNLAHRISQQVRAEIQKAWPAVQDVTVHVEPYYVNDH